ncbi:MAG: hypothetical protein QOK02_4209 [Mycobacterium sp.]|jgi:hypothetical protein|nr:hypothetical protein [Mycobacterium sp.]
MMTAAREHLRQSNRTVVRVQAHGFVERSAGNGSLSGNPVRVLTSPIADSRSINESFIRRPVHEWLGVLQPSIIGIRRRRVKPPN